MKNKFLHLAPLALICMGVASASLVDQGPMTFQATGLGTVPTVLTVQARGTSTVAYGCVAGTGGQNDVLGGTSCPSAVSWTDTGFTQQGQTQTQLISSALNATGFSGGITSLANLALVLNVSQTGQAQPVTLNNLTLNITNASGTTYKSSGIIGCPNTDAQGNCILTPLSPGTGSAGYVFTLNQAQQQAAMLALFGSTSATFNPAGLHVGASMYVSNSVGSVESVFLGAVPPQSAVPEPASFMLIGGGLIAAALLYRRRAA